MHRWQPRFPPPRIKPWGHVWRYLLALLPIVVTLVISAGTNASLSDTEQIVNSTPTISPSQEPSGSPSQPPSSLPSQPPSSLPSSLPTSLPSLSPQEQEAVTAAAAEARDRIENRVFYMWLDLGIGMAGLIVMAFRRRWPLAVTGVLSIASFWSQSVAGAWAIAMVSLATRRRWREVIPLAVLTLALQARRAAPDLALLGLVPLWVIGITVAAMLLVVATVVATGFYIGTNRELVASLKDDVATAEREQQHLAERAQQEERARIAREMHDVLAHRISVIAMHAGAMEYRRDLDAAESAQAAGVIREYAHQALTDLRAVLGVLRSPPLSGSGSGSDSQDGLAVAPEPPQPTLGDIPNLVRDCVAEGMTIDFADGVDTGNAELLPHALGRSAYRIVQEALTNARKHAPGSRVALALAGMPGADLTVRVANPLSRQPATGIPGSRLGLVGLKERAVLTGGTLEHQVTVDGQFEVVARLPWPQDPPRTGAATTASIGENAR